MRNAEKKKSECESREKRIRIEMFAWLSCQLYGACYEWQIWDLLKIDFILKLYVTCNVQHATPYAQRATRNS